MLTDCPPAPVAAGLRPPSIVATCAGGEEGLLDCLLDASNAQVLAVLQVQPSHREVMAATRTACAGAAVVV